MATDDPMATQRDSVGRVLCSAKNRQNDACRSPALTGMDKCRFHVGMSVEEARNRVAARLAFLVEPAVEVLNDVMQNANVGSRDRIRAATAVLDRAGYSTNSPNPWDMAAAGHDRTEEAKELILERIKAWERDHPSADN